MTEYHDRWIDCTAGEIRVRGYYFPWGTKRIPYGTLRGMRRVALGPARGQWRIWGTGNPHYWLNLDPRRPSKKVGFVLDLGRRVSPFLTPDDPDGFESAVRAHAGLAPGLAPGPAPGATD